jgi:predicted glycosyl hydrolase (DUF1957 family)
MSKTRTRIHLTPQEQSVIERTVNTVSEILDMIMSKHSAKEYAIMLCKPHRQSTKSLGENELHEEAEKSAQYTLHRNYDNFNFFINVIAGALALRPS